LLTFGAFTIQEPVSYGSQTTKGRQSERGQIRHFQHGNAISSAAAVAAPAAAAAASLWWGTNAE